MSGKPAENAAGDAVVKEAFDPYRVWLSIPKSEQPPHHYRLLGVSLFEADPQVIEEAADRQIAHLKTKQTGKHVALSQQLLQQVATAAGCLLDEDAKRKYDKKLRKSLVPPAAPAETTKPAASEAPAPASSPAAAPQSQPAYQQPAMPYAGQGYPAAGYSPAYAQPGYVPHQTPAQSYAPLGYVAPPVQHYAPPPPHQSLRPIPVAPPEAPPIDIEEEASVGPMLAGAGMVSRGRSHGRSSSGDMFKLIVVGGVCLAFALVGFYLYKSGLLAGTTSVAQVTKPKSALKITKTVEQTPSKATTTTPAETPATTTPTTNPKTSTVSDTGATKTGTTTETPPVTKPTTPADPAVPMPNPAPLPGTDPTAMPVPVTPLPMPVPMPTSPTNTGLTNPLAGVTPNNPAPSPGAKKIWRHLGGFIEQLADGTWKELAPSGDYFTLTPLGQGGDTWEFDRPASDIRIRLFDNRYEYAATPFTQYVEAAKGTWTVPLEEIELEAPQQNAIKKHCDAYAEILAKARKGMLEKFDIEMSPNRKRVGKADEWLALLEVLKAEKSRFETEGLLPWSGPMRAASADYLKMINAARAETDRRLDGIVQYFVKHDQQAAANSVLVLRQRTLAPLVVAKLIPNQMPANGGNVIRPFGRFGRNEDDEADRGHRLWSNWSLNDAASGSKWTFDNNGLVLSIVRSGSTSRDQIAVADNGTEFSARSNSGNNYTGVFASTIDLHERRPEAKYNPPPKADPAKPVAAAEAVE
ncbi:hypothetical protein NA78x_001269 [Anatilimnocola sp. NA78]|uniref:hypothetical protein n=1 Tax=Anatilimnocola sp. NA78 TaxID=3415683 RepID=UPI003CE56F77